MVKQRQKSKNDTNYKRLEKNSDTEEETELLVRQKAPKKDMATVEKEVEEGDTLQSLAIRYRCTIEDIKRLNNIHKDNEIFARRTIKVPHYPISQALAGVHDPVAEKALKETTLLNLEPVITKESEINTIIFNSNVAKISPQNSHEIAEDLLDEEQVHLLPKRDNQVETIPRLSCSGVDGDISLKALIVCIVIIIFAVPVIYVVYIAEHPEQYDHHSHHHNVTNATPVS